MAGGNPKICLFGGSFNPIHKQHLQIAKDALKQFTLNKVIFIPTINPPHKADLGTKISDRIRMIELAIAPFRDMEVSSLESFRSGSSYTFDTLNQIKKKYSNADIYYLIGEDSLNYLDQWYRAKDLFQMVQFIVCDRYDKQNDRRKEIIAQGAKLLFLETKPLDISSTEIRKKLQKQEFVEDIPLAVYEYIVECNLYSSTLLPPIFTQYLSKLSTLINHKRLAHSLCVAYTARELAKLHGIDPIICTTAAILHDCAKALPLPVMQNFAKKRQLYFDADIYESSLLHAPVGAEMAKELFGVQDENVYSAITYHTTGMMGMNTLDTIIFLADKIEPTRSPYPQLEEIRQLAKKDLKKALLLSIMSTENYLKLINKSLSKNTKRLLESLQK